MAAPPPLTGQLPVPFGNKKDAHSFFSAFVPKARTAVAPKALVPLVDTMLLAKGRPTRWLATGEEGEASEKLSTNKDELLNACKAVGASPHPPLPPFSHTRLPPPLPTTSLAGRLLSRARPVDPLCAPCN